LKLADGRDEANPCKGAFGITWWCGQADVNAWRDRVDFVFRLIRREWNRSVDAGLSMDAVRGAVTTYESLYEGLPEYGIDNAFGLNEASAEVNELVEHLRMGACCLEMLEGLLAKGGQPTLAPGGKVTPRDPGAISPWVWAAIIAGGALWLLFL
jgi:hypothetical protein